jgi:hypothetical protein
MKSLIQLSVTSSDPYTEHRLQMCYNGRFLPSARAAWQCWTDVLFPAVKQRLETGWTPRKHTYFHQLNGRKLLSVFNSAINEGLQLYSPIQNLTISICTLFGISSNAFSGLMVRLISGDDRDILREEIKTYLIVQSSPLDSSIFFSSAYL